MFDATSRSELPNAPGVGYKPQHFAKIIEAPAPVEWLEIHAENYMGQGARPIAPFIRALPNFRSRCRT